MRKKDIIKYIDAAGFEFRSLLGVGSNAKTVKSDKSSDWLTAIQYLQPDLATCPNSIIAECAKACLNTAGRGGMNSVQLVRHDRTRCFHQARGLFESLLKIELASHERKALRLSKQPACRLNGTSDIGWREVINAFPNIMFYDYTKVVARVRRWARGEMPKNYHLTLSYSSASEKYKQQCDLLLESFPHVNVAVVFRSKELVDSLVGSKAMGRTVIDGDKTDLRFTDPAGSLVALYAKGAAKHDRSGFVHDEAPTLA